MSKFCEDGHALSIYIGQMGGVHLWNCERCQATLSGSAPAVAADEAAELAYARERLRTAENLYLWTRDDYYLQRAKHQRDYVARLEARIAKRGDL